MCPYESNCKYHRQLGKICVQKFICLFYTIIFGISDLMKFHVKHKLENLQLMWMTIVSNPNSLCMKKLEDSNLRLNEFPVGENAFFDCFSDQIGHQPLVVESSAYSTPEIIRNILHNYIVEHAEEIQVIILALF